MPPPRLYPHHLARRGALLLPRVLAGVEGAVRQEKVQKKANELNMLMGEVAYRRMRRAEAVLLLMWDDLPEYLKAAQRAGKQTEFIKLLDDWATHR